RSTSSLVLDRNFFSVLCPSSMKRSLAVDAPVGMRPEVIAQSLDEVRRQPFLAIGVVVGQRGAEGGNGDAALDRHADHAAPGVLGLRDRVPEIGDEQQILDLWIGAVGVGDAVQEA